MFSYRHAFHAGNHADVLKHATLLHIFNYYAQKDSAFSIIDTHCGAGIYDLEHDWAQTKGEFYDGLDRVLQQDDYPELVEHYIDAIADLNPDGTARYYPGSPWLALERLRTQDSFHGFELHPSEFEVLSDNVAQLFPQGNRRVRLYPENGFEQLGRLLPPPSRRAIAVPSSPLLKPVSSCGIPLCSGPKYRPCNASWSNWIRPGCMSACRFVLRPKMGWVCMAVACSSAILPGRCSRLWNKACFG